MERNSWQATEKPEMKPYLWDGVVGEQQKNQSLKGDNSCHVGNNNSYLGLIYENGLYIPNTVIQNDIKCDTLSQSRVLAVFSKEYVSNNYNQIKYVAKGIDITRLRQTLQNKVNIAPELTEGKRT